MGSECVPGLGRAGQEPRGLFGYWSQEAPGRLFSVSQDKPLKATEKSPRKQGTSEQKVLASGKCTGVQKHVMSHCKGLCP